MLPLIQVGAGGGASGTFPSTIAKVSHQWLDSYSAITGLFTQSQPAFTDISGAATPAQGAVASCTVTNEGYWLPEPYSESFVGKAFSTNLTIAATANRIYLVQVVLSHIQKVSALSFATGSGAGITTGNNFGYGIYSHDGSSLLLSINVPGVVAVSTGVRTTITPVTLNPGVYWIAWVCTLTTTAMNAISNNANSSLFGSIAGSQKRWGFSSTGNVSTAGSLPASVTLPDTFLAQNFPSVLLEA